MTLMMKEADRDRIRELCSLVAAEQDRNKLLQFIEELSRLLGAKDECMRGQRLGN